MPTRSRPWLTDWRGRYHGARAGDALAGDRPRKSRRSSRSRARASACRWCRRAATRRWSAARPRRRTARALILSLRRMNRDPRDRCRGRPRGRRSGRDPRRSARRGAEAAGRRFPLTLGARGSATIGGLVSTNAGGTQVLRFGTMRALVAGVEAVLPDGSVHDGLAALKKDNRGYDLNQLLIGAEGTLGIVTAATLRLVPGDRRARGRLGRASPTRTARWRCCARWSAATDAIESFETAARRSARRWCSRTFPARARRSPAPIAWHVLIEAVATDRGAEPPAALLERAARRRRSTRAWSPTRRSPRARRRPRRSGACAIRSREAERAAGPAIAARHLGAGRRHAALHDRGGARRARRAFPGTHASALRPSRRRQRPFPRPRARRAPIRRAGTPSDGAGDHAASSTIWSSRRADRSRPSTASAR